MTKYIKRVTGLLKGGESMKQIEHASTFTESRAAAIETFKRGKELYEKRHALIIKINKILKK